MKNNISYFLHVGSTKIDENKIAKNLNLDRFECYKTNTTSFIFHNEIEFKSYNKYSVAIIGEIENSTEILNENFTLDKINLLIGSFAIFIIKNKTLYFYLSLDGKIPVYLIEQNGQIFITSELKSFCNTNYFLRKLIPIENYNYSYTSEVEQTFSLMQNVERIIPGFLYKIDIEKEKISAEKTKLKSFQSLPKEIDIKQAKEILNNLLIKQTQALAAPKQTIAVALSGGVDSGTILGLLSKTHNDIHTFSIGTEFGNEFDKAKISATFSNSKHHEIFINDDDYREGILNSVFYNELCDPLYAEGYIAFYHFFKNASKFSDTFFTGYGADLILGNMHQTKNENDVNDINAAWCKRTSWTGELSPFLANNFNSKMHFPFWNEELINYGLSLPIKHIQNSETEKIVLRTMSEEMKLVHPDIAWNKKTALTQGTSLDKVFSKILNIEYTNNYYVKSIFLYYLYEDFFVNDKSIQEIDFNFLIQKTKNYVDNK